MVLISLTQIPTIEWEKYLDETAQIIVRKQSSEALLDARNRLYEIISRCIPPQTIFVVSYCLPSTFVLKFIVETGIFLIIITT